MVIRHCETGMAALYSALLQFLTIHEQLYECNAPIEKSAYWKASIDKERRYNTKNIKRGQDSTSSSVLLPSLTKFKPSRK